MKRIPPILVCGDGCVEIPISVYPDNVPLANWCGVALSLVRSLLVRPLTLTDFMTAMFWADAFTERTGQSLHLVLPAVPGARQDRLNREGDFLFTAKSVAREINLRRFKTVTILDPHSEVTPALIDNCRVVHSHEMPEITTVLEKDFVYGAVISPDAGSEKRALGMAKRLGVPLVHAWKTRSVRDGSITGFGCERINPSVSKRLLVVDDICDGGGTFLGLRDLLAKATDLPCDLFVTHGLFSKNTAALMCGFGKVFCTDSLSQSCSTERIQVIEVCEQLAKGPSFQ